MTTSAVISPSVAYELPSGTVVDRNELNRLPTAEISDRLAALYASGKKITIVDNAKKFFSTDSLIRALDQNDPSLVLILEYNDIEVTADELAIVREFNSIKARITDIVKERKLSLRSSLYPFADVPANWNVDDRLEFSRQYIKRSYTRGMSGDESSDYGLGYAALERLWLWISPAWAKNVLIRDLPNHSVRTQGTYYNAEPFSDSHVRIGCQRIRRFELEQLAVKQGWAFPAECNTLGLTEEA